MELWIIWGMAAVFGLVGIIFLTVSILMTAAGNRHAKNCTAQTVGTVTDMQRETTYGDDSSAPSTSWFPVYEYYAGNRKITKRSYYGQARQIFYTGQKVTVWYNPENCNEFYVPEEKSGKFKWIFGLTGAALIIFALLAVLVCRLITAG